MNEHDVQQRCVRVVVHRFTLLPGQWLALEFSFRERALEACTTRAVVASLADAQEAPHGAHGDPEKVGEEDVVHGGGILTRTEHSRSAGECAVYRPD